jgi:hypothetical protein
LLTKEETEINSDPDTLGGTPISTYSIFGLLDNYAQQREALTRELEQGARLHTDERDNAQAALDAINDGVIALEARRSRLSTFNKTLSIRTTTETKRLFDKSQVSTAKPFVLDVVSPATVVVINAYEGVIDLSAESAARAPQKSVLETELKDLYDQLKDAVTEAQRQQLLADIQEKEAEYTALARCAVEYRYIDNPIVLTETVTLDSAGKGTITARPVTRVVQPANGQVEDGREGKIVVPEVTGSMPIDYSANMATLYGMMTGTEKTTRLAEIVARRSFVSSRLAQLELLFRRRNIVT